MNIATGLAKLPTILPDTTFSWYPQSPEVGAGVASQKFPGWEDYILYSRTTLQAAGFRDQSWRVTVYDRGGASEEIRAAGLPLEDLTPTTQQLFRAALDAAIAAFEADPGIKWAREIATGWITPGADIEAKLSNDTVVYRRYWWDEEDSGNELKWETL